MAARTIPIYTTHGDLAGVLQYPYLFNRQGEWIGWVTAERQVYSVHGNYVGWLTDEPRIVRKQSSSYLKPRVSPPPTPAPITPPGNMPLPPMMPELPMGTFDVFEERPDLLPSMDFGDMRDDMD